MAEIPETPIEDLQDSLLVDWLCRVRATFSLPLGNDRVVELECLIALERIWHEKITANHIVAQEFINVSQPSRLVVLPIAIIRDAFREYEVETLRQACQRDRWTVARAHLGCWFDLIAQASLQQNELRWCLRARQSDQQLVMQSLMLQSRPRRRRWHSSQDRVVPELRWATPFVLPSTTIFDFSNHNRRLLPAPSQWEIAQRNGRVLIRDSKGHTFGLCAAQYGMLVDLKYEQGGIPSTPFLLALRESSRAQERTDRSTGISWSRNFLAKIQEVSGATGLIGVRAVTFHPHFEAYVSNDASEIMLGAIASRSLGSALLFWYPTS